jgi:hypothetical protein
MFVNIVKILRQYMQSVTRTFCPELATKTQMSVADVTVALVKIYGLIASTVFTVQGYA